MSFTPPPRATFHCRYYSFERGMYESGPKCAAGIALDQSPNSTLACMPDAERPACVWREEYSDAERQTWTDWQAGRAARLAQVMTQIPGSSRDPKREHHGKSGEFPCPACEAGTVRWVRARSNGHLHAACTTPGCFGVIE